MCNARWKPTRELLKGSKQNRDNERSNSAEGQWHFQKFCPGQSSETTGPYEHPGHPAETPKRQSPKSKDHI